MVIRLALLAVLGSGAWLVAGWTQRRRIRGRLALPAGITLITGPGCSMCIPVERALVRAGARPVVTDVAELMIPGLTVRSLPTVLVVDEAGTVVMRRSGRAALNDAALLAGTARPHIG